MVLHRRCVVCIIPVSAAPPPAGARLRPGPRPEEPAMTAQTNTAAATFAAYDDQAIWGVGATPEAAVADATATCRAACFSSTVARGSTFGR